MKTIIYKYKFVNNIFNNLKNIIHIWKYMYYVINIISLF